MQVELSVPEPSEVFIDPRDSVLVIVDMQNYWLKRESSPLYERGQAALARTEVLLERFRQAGARVIHVRSERRPDALEFTVFGQEPHLLEGTWDSQIVDELAPLIGEPVVPKLSHDCFNATPLEAILNEFDLRPCRTQVVIAGLATNVAFDCAVTGFRVRGFMVYVPLDATASATEVEELLAFQHFLGTTARRQYNTIATRSDMLTMDGARVASDPLAGSITRSDAVLRDPLYRAITTLTVAA